MADRRPTWSTATHVVNVRADAWTTYIGRANRVWGLPASEWGNPYPIVAGDRPAAIQRYLDYLAHQPDLLARVVALRGERLGCWCAPRLCHGHALALLADGAPTDYVLGGAWMQPQSMPPSPTPGYTVDYPWLRAWHYASGTTDPAYVEHLLRAARASAAPADAIYWSDAHGRWMRFSEARPAGSDGFSRVRYYVEQHYRDPRAPRLSAQERTDEPASPTS